MGTYLTRDSVKYKQRIEYDSAQRTFKNWNQSKKDVPFDETALRNERRINIRDAVNSEVDGSVYTILGGSTSKHTNVYGLSDVDLLMFINKSSLKGKTPRQIRCEIKRILQSKLKGVKHIRSGKLAVTIKYNDGSEVQVLPAVKSGSGYMISGSDGRSWSPIIRPRRFTSELTRNNRKCHGRLVPFIKLLKSLNDSLPKSQRMKSYHIEALAVKVFKNYPRNAPHTDSAMLEYYTKNATKEVRKPITDMTGQSKHVDDYAGKRYSSTRSNLANGIKKQADMSKGST